MNETLKAIIEQSGEMWAKLQPRHDSPVLVKLDESDGPVFELTLPKGEGHPFWRINERPITPDELETFLHSARLKYGPEWRLGNLYPLSNGKYMLTQGYIYNGREPYRWLPSTERVRVTVEKI